MKTKTIEKEYMMSVEEVKKLFPIGSVQSVDGQNVRVLRIEDALPCTCFASFPRVRFEVLQDMDG